ncbi:Cytochrome b6-f complex iron-sulfur subunit [[Leptolyngbya] sp. PCC 7376]|uniref:cytochrome b6-f complex iron-sulfur subunit n=1 Tax=[Leptolyngbya] sp. PCC 7376 TaxID=111781 RepID=UPI00029F29D6|nr:cytochrome b6-f complex iron-sulfur subunit [[Leptolyngbya] sp. PCC 7376]AFY37052.1 Cytochrome b6-f complex iron-sulfur subunit [[Leptolyngbya] sp. PCC 7376]
MEDSFSIDSPSLSRRQLLNFLTGAVVVSTVAPALYPAAKYFVPPRKVEEDGSLLAKDINGNLIPVSQLLAEEPGTRALVAGLAGEPTYVTIKEDDALHPWGIVDNCTHLGCTFPWNENDAQFQCPCHGSRYDSEGRVVRGPAPLPLRLIHVQIDGKYIRLVPWTELDPRTGEKPWWM